MGPLEFRKYTSDCLCIRVAVHEYLTTLHVQIVCNVYCFGRLSVAELLGKVPFGVDAPRRHGLVG